MKRGKFKSGLTATVCDNCSESFISEDISRKLLATVQLEAKKGVEVEILNYAA